MLWVYTPIEQSSWSVVEVAKGPSTAFSQKEQPADTLAVRKMAMGGRVKFKEVFSFWERSE